MTKSALVIDGDYDSNEFEDVRDVSVGPENGVLSVVYERKDESIVEVFAPGHWVRVVYREGN